MKTDAHALLKSFISQCFLNILPDMDTTMRRTTRSPVALARKAMQIASRTLPVYASKFSKRDFTQPQLVAMLTLKQFFKTDDRGLVALLHDWRTCGRYWASRRFRISRHCSTPSGGWRKKGV
jgi:hypothetical protein